MSTDSAKNLFAEDMVVECGKDREEAERRVQKNISGLKKWADG